MKEFHNKILFCDVIGYSKRSPIDQYAIQMLLNRAVGQIIRQLDTPLDERLIALPTGDGMVLNFLAADPDIHLRAALILLEQVANGAEGLAIGLRVGLNTDVDRWTIDINGKRNVVGRGINAAQRVMNLGGHAQVMMNDHLRTAFAIYPHYLDKIIHIGRFRVKHDEELDIAQFVDPNCSFVSSQLIECPSTPVAPVNFSDILKLRAAGGILSLELNDGAKGSLSMIEAHVAEYLDTLEPLQSFRIAAGWIVRELLDNAFTHGALAAGEVVKLHLDQTGEGISIAVEQPDLPEFDLHQYLRAPADGPSFLRMMHDAGLKWDQPRFDGRMQIAAALPKSFCTPVRNIDPLGPESSNDIISVTAPFAQVDEINWERFRDWLSGEATEASKSRSSLLVDLRDVNYMSSVGLRALTLAKRNAAGTEIILTGVEDRLGAILAVSRYDKMFRILRRG
jgi:anti-anti-sigma factor